MLKIRDRVEILVDSFDCFDPSYKKRGGWRRGTGVIERQDGDAYFVFVETADRPYSGWFWGQDLRKIDPISTVWIVPDLSNGEAFNSDGSVCHTPTYLWVFPTREMAREQKRRHRADPSYARLGSIRLTTTWWLKQNGYQKSTRWYYRRES